jgi:hypothetical protein
MHVVDNFKIKCGCVHASMMQCKIAGIAPASRMHQTAAHEKAPFDAKREEDHVKMDSV